LDHGEKKEIQDALSKPEAEIHILAEKILLENYRLRKDLLILGKDLNQLQRKFLS